ncbi:MAG: precorrin-2 C(20)-methyltransferase [Alphaproteobacteria bacterium]|nr:precorrin-2 C(20)-methyltransferase [Alphaproteobacteria bacterium]
MERGRLYGLGAGPGDPELLTLKALRLLQEVPVIAYPSPEHADSFARSIVAQWLKRGQREIALRFPMRPGPPPVEIYDRAATALAAELDRGRDVALLCQGDPLFYGSFINLFTRLAGRYHIEIVPGVTSLTACAAAAAAPLVMRDDVLSVIPATLDEAQLYGRIAAANSIAVIKLGRHIAKLRRVLDRLGLIDAAVYVEHATLPTQRIAPLAAVEPEEAPYFSMALIRRAPDLVTAGR